MPIRDEMPSFLNDYTINFISKLFNSISDGRGTAVRLLLIDTTTNKIFNNFMLGAGTAKRDGRKKARVKAHVLIDASRNVPEFSPMTEAEEHDWSFHMSCSCSRRLEEHLIEHILAIRHRIDEQPHRSLG